ncbi:transcription antitermination factor NusB [Helicobacter labetoulli]|uniref:transcription antitermination factor NusB n=1 Tax=Helicobacter labetoulli TaxID=2315333 RepID=UPI000EF690CB|nr:transcription antitermination factor NusB [Helicobacter labetoulli]
MATRTQAREAVIGMLYAYDLGNEDILSIARIMLEEKKIKNKQQDFAFFLLQGAIEHLQSIDEAIIPYLKEWDFSRLGGMERAMLRLGAYEILYTDTDSPVVINEAIELGKMYGGEDNAPRFLNGVLDALSKAHKETKKQTSKVVDSNKGQDSKKAEAQGLDSTIQSVEKNK